VLIFPKWKIKILLINSACGYFVKLTIACAVVRLLNYPTAAINSYDQNSSFWSSLWLTLS